MVHDPGIDDRTALHTLGCMEIWDGNRTVRDGVSVPGIDAWILSQPFAGGDRGGDVYFLSMCGAGKISRFVVADVSGHGAAVDGVARTLRRLMRKHINRVDQTRFARTLNKEMRRLYGDGCFATALLATYFAPTDQLVVCNLGHPRPLWYHAPSRRWDVLDERDRPGGDAGAGNLPLGVLETPRYGQFAVRLAKDDVVLIYTDGSTESMDADRRTLGERGLLAMVRDLDPQSPTFAADLRRAVAERRGPRDSEDDETLLVLHHNAADPPPPTFGGRLHVLARMIGLPATAV